MTSDLSRRLASEAESPAYDLAFATMAMVKRGAIPSTAISLAGTLYSSSSGWLMLSVPNAIGRGLFDALDELGVELPTKDGGYNAHISVMTDVELASIGGPGKVSERGHRFRYTTGPLQVVEPAGWKEMSKVWFVQIKSPELEKLRKSYGLPALPRGDQHFHVSVAVKRKKVLQNSDIAKV